jgi:outer membrane lipoprotein-sorting protein
MNVKAFFSFISILLAAAVLSFPPTVRSSPQVQELTAEEADAFFLEMADVLKTKKSMQVDFNQERHLSMLLEPLVSQGICFFNDPDKLRWEIFEPYESLLIFNGNSVAKYDFDQGIPRRLNLGSEDIIREVLAQILDWMKGDFRNSAEVYNIRIFRNEYFRLRLIPRSAGLLENIQFIELHIDPPTKHITQVIIQESETDFVRIGFFNEQNNLDLDGQLFDLNDPLVWIRGTDR